jgi:hypothetical protein
VAISGERSRILSAAFFKTFQARLTDATCSFIATSQDEGIIERELYPGLAHTTLGVVGLVLNHTFYKIVVGATHSLNYLRVRRL